jgi:glycine/D-amino acid oxidase-like deaminating enzyme
MLGVTMAPSTGALVADLLTGRKPSIPLRLLNPDRYA